MTEDEIKREARMMALERFACHTHNIALGILARMANMGPEEVNEIERQSLEGMRMVPVQVPSAALSDVLSDEAFQDLSRLIEYARDLRSKA